MIRVIPSEDLTLIDEQNDILMSILHAEMYKLRK